MKRYRSKTISKCLICFGLLMTLSLNSCAHGHGGGHRPGPKPGPEPRPVIMPGPHQPGPGHQPAPPHRPGPGPECRRDGHKHH